jgi:hypothetical protein
MHDHVKGLCFLRKILWHTFDDIEQEEEADDDDVCLQQYHILPHFCHDVQNALNIQYPHWWIGRGRPIL